MPETYEFAYDETGEYIASYGELDPPIQNPAYQETTDETR
jgi:hypothetical protein